MDRAEIIFQLEQYWYEQQRKNPDELMDIPCAISWYWSMPMRELLWEYNSLIG